MYYHFFLILISQKYVILLVMNFLDRKLRFGIVCKSKKIKFRSIFEFRFSNYKKYSFKKL